MSEFVDNIESYLGSGNLMGRKVRFKHDLKDKETSEKLGVIVDIGKRYEKYPIKLYLGKKDGRKIFTYVSTTEIIELI